MSTSETPLTAAQQNNRLVTQRITAGDGDTAERDMVRVLGKAIINLRREVVAVGAPQSDRSFGAMSQSLNTLFRSIDALIDAADAAYEWHAGDPVPQDDD